MSEPPSRLAAARVDCERCPGNLQPAAHRAVGPQRRAGGVGVRQLGECATEPVHGRRSGGGDRRRVGEQLADLAGDADRQAERGVDEPSIVSTGFGGGAGAGSWAVDRAAGGLGGVAGQVDVLHRHAHAVDPVGDRVVHLRHQRRLAAFQPLDDEELPQRAGAVERVEDEQAGEVEAAGGACPAPAGRRGGRGGRCRSRGRRPRSGRRARWGWAGPASRAGARRGRPTPCAPAGGRSPAAGRGSSPRRTSTPGTGPSRRATSALRRRSSGGRPRRRPSDGRPQRSWAAPDRRPSAQPATSSGRRQARSSVAQNAAGGERRGQLRWRARRRRRRRGGCARRHATRRRWWPSSTTAGRAAARPSPSARWRRTPPNWRGRTGTTRSSDGAPGSARRPLRWVGCGGTGA